MVEPTDFTVDLLRHLRNFLHPLSTHNAQFLRMTAAAGAELAEP